MAATKGAHHIIHLIIIIKITIVSPSVSVCMFAWLPAASPASFILDALVSKWL